MKHLDCFSLKSQNIKYSTENFPRHSEPAERCNFFSMSSIYWESPPSRTCQNILTYEAPRRCCSLMLESLYVRYNQLLVFFVSIIITLLTDLVPPLTGFRRLTCTYIKPVRGPALKSNMSPPICRRGFPKVRQLPHEQQEHLLLHFIPITLNLITLIDKPSTLAKVMPLPLVAMGHEPEPWSGKL